MADRAFSAQVVHRVERDESVHDFAQRERSRRQKQNRARPEEHDSDAEQDIVELSAPHEVAPPAVATTRHMSESVDAFPDRPSLPDQERHIDIEV
jgi:hypothetical protein